MPNLSPVGPEILNFLAKDISLPTNIDTDGKVSLFGQGNEKFWPILPIYQSSRRQKG